MDGVGAGVQTGTMFTDRFYQSADGLRLHYRDYPGAADRPAVLCLHGLTRNARDFEGVAARLAVAGWRVIVPDIRGRGASDPASDPATYALPIYLADMDALSATAGFDQAVHIGTSMGALLTMLTAAARPGRVAGACLNDIGPVIEIAGLERIAGYLGRTGPFEDWTAAAAAIAATDRPTFPAYGASDWALHARRRFRDDAAGIVADYDPQIARTFSIDRGTVGVTLWPLFEALAGVPVLSVRGECSDLFTAGTQDAMAARVPGMDVVVVPGVGHAPSMEEAEAVEALDRLLVRVRAG